MKRFLLCFLSLPLAAADPALSNAWSEVAAPRGAFSQAIGGYANGCQSGAVMVPEVGEGFYDIRRWRKRFYTQPVTLRLIEAVGRSQAPRRILLGDSSQAIGGRMPFGHSSHQNGLDVDFWFYSLEAAERPPRNIEPPSMVDKIQGRMLLERWQASHREALYAAASFPETARIFVNPVIKQHLCETEADRSWLWKLRPWGGHDAHFHVRLHCPPDSPLCEEQAPLNPLDDGCNADLLQWIADQSAALLQPKKTPVARAKKPPEPPAQCLQLLHSAP